MRIFNIIIFLIHTLWLSTALVQEVTVDSSLDKSIENFLDQHKNSWRDMNIPAGDGKVLYDLIIKNNYTQALEIGTSTGHSAIWMAWALSKTGGKLITIEISETRYKKALENFQKAGVDSFIDARLANAHDLVPQLEDPFDFIFVDADKEWYSQYLKWLLPKMATGGCFAAHNVSNTFMSGIPEFLEYLDKTKELETSIIESSPSGISVSYLKDR
ncbi:MAG: class I SAM-dependent methyltransferase [Calditrichia bacterium]|nr:class I SAM-dependent methyltransferase [Calditrichia bacterium]